jgi:hypothetical protein
VIICSSGARHSDSLCACQSSFPNFNPCFSCVRLLYTHFVLAASDSGRSLTIYQSRATFVLRLEFCSVLFCSVLFCSVLFCSVLFCSVLFCSVALRCALLSFSVLCCVALCYVPCGIYRVCRPPRSKKLSSGGPQTPQGMRLSTVQQDTSLCNRLHCGGKQWPRRQWRPQQKR